MITRGLLARHSWPFPLVSAVLPEVSLVMRAAGVNDAAGFREPYRRRGILSHSLSVLKKNPQLIRHHIPVPAYHRPVIYNILRRKIQHFPQRVIVGERRLVFRNLPELTVQSFNDVRCIYDLPNFGRICIERGQNIPVLLPASHTAWDNFLPIWP